MQEPQAQAWRAFSPCASRTDTPPGSPPSTARGRAQRHAVITAWNRGTMSACGTMVRNKPALWQKGCDGFSRRDSIQKKPKEMGIWLRQNGALKLHTLQCILVATILLCTYDDHAAAGLVCPMLVRCVGAGHVLGRWPWSGGVPPLLLAHTPGAGDTHTAEGIITSVHVHEPSLQRPL